MVSAATHIPVPRVRHGQQALEVWVCVLGQPSQPPPTLLLTGPLLYTMSDGTLLLVAACGKSSKVARQLIEMEEAQAARSGFWAGNANEKENDKYLHSWFHLLMLYTQGTFSSWYKVLRQVGETNI